MSSDVTKHLLGSKIIPAKKHCAGKSNHIFLRLSLKHPQGELKFQNTVQEMVEILDHPNRKGEPQFFTKLKNIEIKTLMISPERAINKKRTSFIQ